jgi:hypothetical protein
LKGLKELIEVKRNGSKKRFFCQAALPAITAALAAVIAGSGVFVSCLQTAYGTGSMYYDPSTTPVDVKSPSFYSDGGAVMLIVKLANGAFKPSPAAGDFLLDGNPLSGTPIRDSDTQVRIIFSSLPAGSHRLTVTSDALLSQATRVSVQAVTSGWFPVDSDTVNNIFDTAQIWSIVYGNGKFVAAGAGGRIGVYYTDTGTWRGVLPGTSAGSGFFETDTIRSIAYGNGKFVAVGYNARIALSTNGTDWNVWNESTFNGDSILAVAYGNGKFIAAGDGGKIRYSGSVDSGTWSNAQWTSPFGSTSILGLAYGEGSASGVNFRRFVAVGNEGKIAWSDDGVTWTVLTSSTGLGTDPINAVTFGGREFVAVGDKGRIARSADGKAWTLETGAVFGNTGVLSVCYGNGKFVVVGHNGKMAELNGGNTGWALITQNCFNKYEKNDYGDQIRAVAYGGGMFIAGGNRYEYPYDNNTTFWERPAAKMAYGY